MAQMQWKNCQLSNCAELFNELPGARPQRYPESVRKHLGANGQGRAVQAANIEVRFVLQQDRATLIVRPESVTRATVFFGDFVHQDLSLTGPDTVKIEIECNPRLKALQDRIPGERAFAPQVVRVMFHGSPVHLVEIEGDVRSPAPRELPARRLLTYGTSITHGGSASAPHLNYATQTARRLGMDHFNLGLGGSCLCEPEVADYIASRQDWDVAVFALSVNMANQGFPLPVFRERVTAVVHKSAQAHPHKPVVCVTLWPYFADLGHPADRAPNAVSEEYRQALRDTVKACPTGNVTLLEGPDLLTDWAGLRTDMLHPSDFGYTEMAMNLADRIRELLG